MAFRKDDAAFQKFVNDEFTEMKKSGELNKLQMKWFGAALVHSHLRSSMISNGYSKSQFYKPVRFQ
jgi:hypothetical protein